MSGSYDVKVGVVVLSDLKNPLKHMHTASCPYHDVSEVTLVELAGLGLIMIVILIDCNRFFV